MNFRFNFAQGSTSSDEVPLSASSEERSPQTKSQVVHHPQSAVFSCADTDSNFTKPGTDQQGVYESCAGDAVVHNPQSTVVGDVVVHNQESLAADGDSGTLSVSTDSDSDSSGSVESDSSVPLISSKYVFSFSIDNLFFRFDSVSISFSFDFKNQNYFSIFCS